ncbi:MAG: hypothetical protein QXJ17_01555 [Nitrososphaeria archaeon]
MKSFDSGGFIRVISGIRSRVIDEDRLIDNPSEERLVRVVIVEGKIRPLAGVEVGVQKIVSYKE